MKTTAKQRRELATAMDFLVAHEPHVHYPPGDRRTGSVYAIKTLQTLERRVLAPQGLTLDCSQSVELLCHVAGLQDPNGLGYRSDGYTGTLLDHLPHYRGPKGASVGALVVFGPGTGEHVCMVRHPGEDPILFSHGQERGPVYIRLSVERRYHRAPVTFLSIAGLGG